MLVHSLCYLVVILIVRPRRSAFSFMKEESGLQAVWLKHVLHFEGWNSWVHRGPPRKSGSGILSLWILSLRIDRDSRGARCVRVRAGACAPAAFVETHYLDRLRYRH